MSNTPEFMIGMLERWKEEVTARQGNYVLLEFKDADAIIELLWELAAFKKAE